MLERIRGVAGIIANPAEEIIVLKENTSKPRLGKLRGMYSIPMETLLPGETVLSAMERLYREELTGLSLPQTLGRYIGVYRIVPCVWAKLYAIKTKSFLLPITFGNPPEVGNHQWASVEEALGLWLRQGAPEMIADYAAGRSGVMRRVCRSPKNCE
jgi:hypothetical protein